MISKPLIAAAIIAIQFVASAELAQAQSSDFDRTFPRQGAEVRISFSIPLGASSDRTKTKPRLDFAVRNYAASSNPSKNWMMIDTERFSRNSYTEARLGFTLEENSKWMLNDQVLSFGPEDDQANIGTAGKIGIGVAAVVLVSVAVIGVLIVDCEARDCFDGE